MASPQGGFVSSGRYSMALLDFTLSRSMNF
jgi:hypothetical protein